MRCAESQRGAVAVGVALLLLVLTTLVCLSAVQIAVGEQRSMAGDVQAQRTLALADLALARGLAQLHAAAAQILSAAGWSACDAAQVEPPCGDGVRNLYDSRWTALADVAAARYESEAGSARLHYLARAASAGSSAPRLPLIQVVGEARSADGRGRALLRQDTLIQPLLAQFPEATVLAASARLGGSARLVTAGALSIWAAGDAQLVDSSRSCRPPESAEAYCGAALSSDSLEAADVLDVDGDHGTNRDSGIAPGDVFERVFGVAAAQWTSIREQLRPLTDCAELGAASSGAWWIDGDCVPAANAAVGSAAAPLLLVVANGRLIADGSRINGLVLLYSHDGGAAGIVATHGATISGALAANGAIDIASGNYVLRDDAGVAAALLSGPSAPTLLTPVAGSWRDY